MKDLRHALPLAAAVLFVASCVSAQAAPSASVAPPAAAVRTVPAARGSIAQTVKLSGSIRSAAQYHLGFRQPGRLAARFVAAGDRVDAGQVLAQLETGDLQAAVVAAQARYDQVVAGASDALEQLLASYGAAKTNLVTLTSGIASDADSLRTGVDDSRGLAKRTITDLQASVGQTADIVAARNTMVAVDGTLRSAQDLIPSLTAAYDDYVAKRDGLLAALGTFETSPTPSAKQRFQIALASFNDAADRCSASVDAILGQLTSAATTAASIDATLNGPAVQIYPDLGAARTDLSRLRVRIAAAQQSGGGVTSRIAQIAGASTAITGYVSGGLTNAQQAVTNTQDRGSASVVASQNRSE